MLSRSIEHHFSASVALYPIWQTDAGRRVILARRRDGLYSPIGGHVEPNENLLEALSRECREEADPDFFRNINLFDPNPLSINRPSPEKTSLGYIYFGTYLGSDLPVSRGDPDIHSIVSLNGGQLKELLTQPDQYLFRPDLNVAPMMALLTTVFPETVAAEELLLRARQSTQRLNSAY